MPFDVNAESASPPFRAKEFFLARQPILNRDQHLVAYELLFRSAAVGPAGVTDELAATAAVIAHASELGLENVIGATLGFVNVDATVLMSDFVEFLPRDKVVLEILETVQVTDSLLARIADLIGAGYAFALDDVVIDSPDVERLLPLASIIKVEVTGMQEAELSRLCRHFRSAGKKLLAEKVETIEEFRLCLNLGFYYFQGYYFARPIIMSGRKLSPSQFAIVQLINLIMADADTAEIERTIKHDATLGLNLMRLVNTPTNMTRHHIDSLGQALMVLGRRQLQRWLQILLYADPGKTDGLMSPLLTLATTRGKLLELMTHKLRPGNSNVAEIGFTVGIMSLMDTLFGAPMDKILEQISVADEVHDALLMRTGFYGEMLQLIEYIETMEKSEALLLPALARIGLSGEDLNAMQLAAFEWSESISLGAN
jgi:c-di-GMP phosphodiesterase